MKPEEKNEEHDFNKPVEKTSIAIAKIILGKIVENQDILIAPIGKREESEVKKQEEVFTDMMIDLSKIISQTDLPFDFTEDPFDRIMALVNAAKGRLAGMKRELMDEYLCRSFGKKSPKTNTYAIDVITLGDAFLKLQEAKEATGNDPADYIPNYRK